MKIGYNGMPPVKARQPQSRIGSALRQLARRASGAKHKVVLATEEDTYNPEPEAVVPTHVVHEATALAATEEKKPRRVHFPRLKNLRNWLMDPHRRGRLISISGVVMGLIGICTGNPVLSLLGSLIALAGLTHAAYFDWKAHKI